MTPEEAIQVADEVLLTHFGKALTDIQRMILSESLAGKGYESMEGYSPQHIKNEGKILWDLLSEALNEPVRKRTFKGALEKRFRLGNVEPKAPQTSNYDEQTWVGREELVSELLTKLQANTRVLWLTGISGIGKTALGGCLANQAWKVEPSFHWVYFEIPEGHNPSFVSVAARLWSELKEHDFDPKERNDPEKIARKLIQKLKSRAYWIQIDSLERLLHSKQSTEFVDPYWKTFLQYYLNESDITSRLVLTAQIFSNTLIEFSDRYPNVWIDFRLRGLLEQEIYLLFFSKREISVKASNQDILVQIAQVYEGHPLALKVISEVIKKNFNGEVVAYWQTYQSEFEQVAKELQETYLSEAEYEDLFSRRVRERIEKSLHQIPSNALDLLCRSSVFRRPVPKKFWLAQVEEYNLEQQRTAYEVLDDYDLVEKEGKNVRQHNLIRSIAYNLLKVSNKEWEISERKAANLWLNDYKPNPDAPNIETVRGYLEAIDHYYNIKNWEALKELFLKEIDSPTQSFLYKQLDVWGYHQESIQLCQKLLGTCGSDMDLHCWNGIGNGFLDLGNYPKAIKAFETGLRVSQETETILSESNFLGNLGIVYNFLGQYEQAIDFYTRQLDIVTKIGDRVGEGRVLGNLGIVYNDLGQYDQAIFYYRQSLIIHCDIGDRHGEGIFQGNLGNTYTLTGQYEQAIKCHERLLTIARNIGSLPSEGTAYGNLGIVYNFLGQYQQSVVYHQKQLAIARETGNLRHEGNALGCMGVAYKNLGQYNQAIECQQKRLTVARNIGDRRGEGNALGNIGVAYHCLGLYAKAVDFHQQQMAIVREIGDLRGEGVAHANLGSTQLKLGKYQEALRSISSGLQIFRKIGDKTAEAESLKAMSELHHALDEHQAAQQYCQQALSIASKLGIPLKEECEELLAVLENNNNE
jgi:tetratricopeptide (TPR) repeat protein